MRNYLKTKGKELKLTTLGFTLIELLAVIVVLAIIALIATPIVTNTIEEVEKGSIESGANNYIKQVETSVALKRMDGIKISDGKYKINSDGNLCLDSECKDLLEIEMSGTKPNGGSIDIENSAVKKEDSFIFIDDYRTIYDTDNNIFTSDLLEVLCTKADGVDLTNLQYGDKFICDLGDNDSKIFYILEYNDNTVSLIMNMNIDENGKGTTSGNTVAWVSKEDYVEAGGTEEEYGETGNNNRGPLTATKELKERTKNWIALDESQISLPSAKQVTKASGKTLDAVVSGLPTWLYENLNSSSAPYAYWTSTPIESYSSSAWRVGATGDVIIGQFVSVPVYRDNAYGIRPVITISKSQLG